MLLPRFEYEAPPDLDAAVARLAESCGEARVLAGGTDLLVKLRRGSSKPRLVVSINRISGLHGIQSGDGHALRIGALTTMTDLAGSLVLHGGLAGIAEGAAAVGGPLIRNRATVGGNIVNGRPCADTVPPLIALGAKLCLQGMGTRRTIDLDGFITGPGQTLIRDDEVLSSIEVPAATSPHAGSAYMKITRRAAMEVTIAGCAAAVELGDDRQTITRARLVLASVAPAPARAFEAEQAIVGEKASDDLIREAGRLAGLAASPIDDCRAPAGYRLEMVDVLARRAFSRALGRAGWSNRK